MIDTDLHVPRAAGAFGLRVDPTGTHLSSTLRLDDLQTLLAGVPASHAVTIAEYREAVIDHNVLGKPTVRPHAGSRLSAFVSCMGWIPTS